MKNLIILSLISGTLLGCATSNIKHTQDMIDSPVDAEWTYIETNRESAEICLYLKLHDRDYGEQYFELFFAKAETNTQAKHDCCGMKELHLSTGETRIWVLEVSPYNVWAQIDWNIKFGSKLMVLQIPYAKQGSDKSGRTTYSWKWIEVNPNQGMDPTESGS